MPGVAWDGGDELCISLCEPSTCHCASAKDTLQTWNLCLCLHHFCAALCKQGAQGALHKDILSCCPNVTVLAAT